MGNMIKERKEEEERTEERNNGNTQTQSKPIRICKKGRKMDFRIEKLDTLKDLV